MFKDNIFQGYLRIKWFLITKFINNRQLITYFQNKFSNYHQTIFFCQDQYKLSNQQAVILTIDDGLSRGGKSTSLVTEVLNILKKNHSTATFFVCSDYLNDQQEEIDQIINQGHELGNHLQKDISNYYQFLTPIQFESELTESSKIIEKISKTKPKYFRSPNGIISKSMKEIIERSQFDHILGDVFCQDHLIKDPKYINYLIDKQIKPGSIVILHMPEKGFREHNLKTLDILLSNLNNKNINCLSLSNYRDLYL